MTAPREAPLLTVAETAARLAVSRRTVERLISTGRLRPLRLGYRTVRIQERELLAFIRANGVRHD